MLKENRSGTTAQRLCYAMELSQKKQADLVRETGINKSAISRYLSGEYEPKQEAIYRLAKALNVSEMWLWGYDVPMERNERVSDDKAIRLGSQETQRFAKRLKELKEAGNISPRKFANEIGISKSDLASYECGEKEPSLSMLNTLADYFGVTVDYLLGRDSFSIDHQALQNSVAKSTSNLYALSLKEHEIIEAYRDQPEMQPAVDKLLNIYEDTNSVKVYRAAKSEESHPDEIISISRERLQKLKDAPETDDIL